MKHFIGTDLIPVRFPPHLLVQAARQAMDEHTGFDDFIVEAVADKLARIQGEAQMKALGYELRTEYVPKAAA